VTRYEWVLARKAESFPVRAACEVAEVSTQAFNDWRRRREGDPTAAELQEAALVEAMWAIDTEFDGTYGQPRMTVELRNQGWMVNHKRVERLMALHGIVGVHKPAKVRTTIPAEDCPPLPDLIGRRFKPGAADVAWIGDITYIRTGQGWLFLATVIDLGSRRLLGYAMADHMRTGLVADALDMAAAMRGGVTAGIIFHSDRGSQYLSGDDNAVAESFFSSLKRELVARYRFQTRANARQAIFVWINRYNNRRLHSSLDYRSPIDWESTNNRQANKAA